MAAGAVVARILTQYSDKGTKNAKKDIAKLGKDFDKFSKKATKVFAVAGAAAVAFAGKVGVDAVKAAMEDQAAQAVLANQLRNTTGATDDAIKSVEKWISSLEVGYGIADDQLRPALARLAAATGSVSSAQGLLALAMDVSAGSTFDLQTVVGALSKAATGNYTALTKLGIKGLDKVSIKAMSANEIFQKLADTFDGAAAAKANTLEGRMARLQLAFKNAKETLGYALLPAVEKLFKMIVEKVIPAVQDWIKENGQKLVAMFEVAVNAVVAFGFVMFKIFDFVARHTKVFAAFGAVLAGIFVAAKVIEFVTAITKIVAAFKAIRAAALGAAAAEAAATGGISVAAAASGVAAFLATVGVAIVGVNALDSKFNSLADGASGVELNFDGLDDITKKLGITFGKNGIVLDKITGKTKDLTKAELEQIQAAKVLAQLKKYGVTTGETDPIQLEAARLNLIKQQNLGIEAVGNAMWDLLEAQLANNVQAQRYADILAVINDNKISTIEVDALAVKWGKSADWVLNYISKVTGINTIVVDKDFGADAAKGWDKAKDSLEAYLAKLGAGTVSPEVQAVVTETDAATKAAEDAAKAADEAVAQAEAAAKAADDLLAKLGIVEVPGLTVNPYPQRSPNAFGPGIANSIYTPTISDASGFAGVGSGSSNVTVNINAGNVIGSQNELVSVVTQGILAGQSSGKKILLNSLEL